MMMEEDIMRILCGFWAIVGFAGGVVYMLFCEGR
jgi:hypothetical protein